MQHVAALTEGSQVLQTVVGRIAVQMRRRQHDAGHPKPSCLHKVGPSGRPAPAIFVWLYQLFPSLLGAAVIFKPETLARWHRSGFRLPLEVTSSCRSACGPGRYPRSDPDDESRQPALGCATHPWRAAEAGYRHRPVHGCQIHGPASPPALSGVAAFLRSHAAHIAAVDLFVGGVPTTSSAAIHLSRPRPGPGRPAGNARSAEPASGLTFD